jgi:transcriptional regulator with XRE-family HTH domain
VPERGSPNLIRRRRLAAELRRLRERAGLTGDQVAELLRWPSSSKLSRIELGRTGLKQADLQNLLNLYDVTSEHREELTALAEESRKAGSIQAGSRRLPGEHVAFLDAEGDAESVWIWEPQIFPGLFQVEGYSRALFQAWVTMFSLPHGEVERRVETRRLRQEVLMRDPPIRLSAVIDESVLHRRFGDASVMRSQLKHVAALSELPHVEVRILPLSGDHLTGTGSFNYIRYRQIHDVPLNDVVAFEHFTSTYYIEAEDNTHKYSVAFESLTNNALAPEDSQALIGTVADEVWT